MEVFEQRDNRQTGKNGRFAAGMIAGIVASLLVFCVGYLGYQVQQKVERMRQESQQVNAGSPEKEKSLGEAVSNKLDILEYMINQYYYQDDVSREALESGIYRGLMNAVGDPYTCYYDARDFETFMEQTSGIYYGIGAYVELDVKRNYPKINKPIPDSPAEEAGLRPGDIIYEVDGVSTYGMGLEKAVSLIKGEEGTSVNITIFRDGEYLDMTLQRRRVQVPTVRQEMLEDGMAYIQITEFDDVTPEQFEKALDKSRSEGMRGLILDLRDNPGGSVNAVVDVARMLLPEGLVVYTEDKYGRREEHKCDGSREFELPLVVLVDGHSASASELLSGAIQDYHKGTLVGTTTFGKGIVQQMIPLRDGSAIKITISSYYTPNGRNIHGVGIEPDVPCPFDSDAYYGEQKFDNQLDVAKDVLAELME